MVTPCLLVFNCDQAGPVYSASSSVLQDHSHADVNIRIPFPAFVTSTYNKLVPEIHFCNAIAAKSVGEACADLIYKPRSAK